MFEKLIVFFKKFQSKVVDRIGHEIGAEDIDGIVKMTKDHACGKEHGRKEEKTAKVFVGPKHQCEEIRNAGMAGKKECAGL